MKIENGRELLTVLRTYLSLLRCCRVVVYLIVLISVALWGFSAEPTRYDFMCFPLANRMR